MTDASFAILHARRQERRLRWIPLAVCLGGVVATLLLWQALAARERAHVAREIELTGALAESEITAQLQAQLQALVRIAQRWEMYRPTREEWEADVRNYIRDYANFQAIEWVDPSFQVRWVVPLRGNEAAQGLNLASEPGQRTALETARDQRATTATHITELAQGGNGFRVYVPIFKGDDFDGFVLGVSRIKQFLDAILHEVIGSGHAVAVFDEGVEIYRRGPRRHEAAWGYETDVALAGITWRMRIWPGPDLLSEMRSPHPEVMLGVGLLTTLLLMLTVSLAQTAQRGTRKAERANQTLKAEVAERKHAEAALWESKEQLQLLYIIISQVASDIDTALHEVLKLTTNVLGMKVGILSRIQGEVYTVEACYAPETALQPGQTFDLRKTYCSITLNAEDVVAINHMAASEHHGHPCYEAFKLESYIGIPIKVDGTPYGTLNFSSTRPKDPPFDAVDRDFIRLLGLWMVSAIRRKQAEEKIRKLNQELEQRVRERTAQLVTKNKELKQEITERKRVEEALHESRRFLDSTLNALSAHIAVLDENGTVVAVNAAWHRFAEANQGDARRVGTGVNYLAVCESATGAEAEETPAVLAGIRAVLDRQRDAFSLEYPCHSPEEERWFVLRASRFSDDGPVRVVVAHENITTRVQAEEREIRLGRILEDSLNEVYIFDADTLRFIQVNRGARDNLGYSMEELQEMTPLDLMPEYTPASFALLNGPLLAGNKEKVRVTTVHRRKDASLYAVDVHLQRSTFGSLPVFVAIILDITDRKQAEKALRKSQTLYQTLYNQTPVMLHSIDREGRLISVSDYWLEALGYEREEALGRKSTEFLTEASQQYARDVILPEYFKTGYCKDVPYQLVKRNGEVIDVLLSATAEWDDAGTIKRSLAVMVDVTKRNRAEEKIRQLNTELEQRVAERTAQLEAANKELEAFSYSVSHDLRAPLRALAGFSKILLEQHIETLNPKAEHYLKRIQANASKMGALVDDLLRFSRLSRQALKTQTVEPIHIAQEVLAELREMQKGRRVDIDISALPPCQADSALLKQVFANLLGNALKYTQQREVARIRVDASVENGQVVYCVADNGVGFDMKYADKLFGVFQRLHRAEDYEGTGVGLALVQRILHRHGGHVWAEAEPDKGATFYFTLPSERKPDDDDR